MIKQILILHCPKWKRMLNINNDDSTEEEEEEEETCVLKTTRQK